MATHAMNQSLGPEGLVPILLVFGVAPRLPDVKRHFPSQLSRHNARVAARKEYADIISKLRIQTAINRRPPPATNYNFIPGDQVYVYRGKPGHFTGTHLLISIQGKDALVNTGNQQGSTHFNMPQLKPAPRQDFPTSNNIRAVYFTEVVQPGDPREQLLTTLSAPSC
jgi:hypothetical protein